MSSSGALRTNLRAAEPAAAARSDARLALGILILGLSALLFGWWAWNDGAYFPGVFQPGAIAVLGVAAAFTLRVPLPASGPWLAALAALLAIGLWTLASGFWSPVPEVAVTDGQLAMTYAAAFALGAWVCALLGRQRLLALAPLVAAGTVVASLTVGSILAGADLSRYLDQDLTLSFPIGYRNANAAFLLVAFFTTVSLLASGAAPRNLRPLLAGSATLLLCLVVLCQSRGSMLGAGVGIAALIALAPSRGRVLTQMALVTAPAAAALPVLLEVFATGESAAARDALRDASLVSVFAALASAGIAWVAPALGDLLPRRIRPRPPGPRARAAVAAAALLAAGLAIGPASMAERIGTAASGFGTGGTPSFDGGSRFSFETGSHRRDFWRVAIAEAGDHPLLGTGAGGFQFAYLRDRQVDYTPADPHSVELLFASELGLPGLALLSALIAAVAFGLRAALRSGRSPWLVVAAAAAGACWLAQASIDWFWAYPGLTLPVIALAGAAVGPEALRRPASLSLRVAVTTLVLVLAGSSVAVYLSWDWTQRAYAEWRSDPGAAYAHLERARAVNPLSSRPALVEGRIAERLGHRGRARSAYEHAIGRVPADWAGHFMLGKLLIEIDRSSAVASLGRAAALNPASRAVRRAQRQAGGGRDR